MDWSFLYGWDSYYFFQGFWLDMKLMVTEANSIVIAACFVVFLAVFLFLERKQLRAKSILFCVTAAFYGTFLLTVTLLGRSTGIESSWDQLFSIYTKAFHGVAGAGWDIFYNIVFYLPVGLLISHYKRTEIDLIVLAAIPTIIEFCQLITTRGLFEISDIINNFIGGLIGLGIARLTSKLYHTIKENRKGGRVERAE